MQCAEACLCTLPVKVATPDTHGAACALPAARRHSARQTYDTRAIITRAIITKTPECGFVVFVPCSSAAQHAACVTDSTVACDAQCFVELRCRPSAFYALSAISYRTSASRSPTFRDGSTEIHRQDERAAVSKARCSFQGLQTTLGTCMPKIIAEILLAL